MPSITFATPASLILALKLIILSNQGIDLISQFIDYMFHLFLFAFDYFNFPQGFRLNIFQLLEDRGEILFVIIAFG
jgi:hypothetical protein